MKYNKVVKANIYIHLLVRQNVFSPPYRPHYPYSGYMSPLPCYTDAWDHGVVLLIHHLFLMHRLSSSPPYLFPLSFIYIFFNPILPYPLESCLGTLGEPLLHSILLKQNIL